MRVGKKKTIVGRAVDVAILKRIFTYVKPYRKNFALAVCTTIFLAFLSPVRPILIQYTLDKFVFASPKISIVQEFFDKFISVGNNSNAEMLFYMTMVLVALLIS